MLNNDTWFDPAYARSTFQPITSNAFDLGTSTKLFRSAYVNNIYGASNLVLGVNTTTWLTLDVSGLLSFVATNFRINANTSDGSDNKGMFLCGGGSNTTTRGGVLFLGGNEYSGFNGLTSLSAGDASSAYLELKAPASTSPTIRFVLTSSEIWRMSGNELTGMVSSNHQIARTNDTGWMIISGGSGAGAQATGAYLTLRGASASSNPGLVLLSSADNSGAYCSYEAAHSAGTHRFRIAGTEKVRINTNGIIGYYSTGGFGILRDVNTGYTYLSGGVSNATSDSAYIAAYGHSHASTPGRLYLYSGAASGLMFFEMGLSSGAFRFRNASAVNLLDISDTQFYCNVPTGGDHSWRVNGVQLMNLSASGLRLPSLADASAANDTWYYSTTQSKACYKNSAGTVNVLY